METIKYYFFYLDTQFKGFPLVIRITLTLVMILGIFYLSSLFRIVFIYRKLKKDKKNRRNATKEFRTKIREIVLSDKKLSFDQVSGILNKEGRKKLEDWEKPIILDILSKINNEKKGNNKNHKGIYESPLNEHNVENVLSALQLRDYLEKQLMSSNEKTIMKSLRSLDDVGGVISGSVVTRKTGIKNDSIRKKAKTVFLKLDSYDPFKFLDNGFDKEFNEWDGICIHDSQPEIPKS